MEYRLITTIKPVLKWLRDFDPLADGDAKYHIEYATENIRAAIRAGLLVGIALDEVDGLEASLIRDINDDIFGTVWPMITVSKN